MDSACKVSVSLGKFYDNGTAYHCGIVDREEKGEGAPSPAISINDPVCYLWFTKNDCQRPMPGQQRGSYSHLKVSEPAGQGVHPSDIKPCRGLSGPGLDNGTNGSCRNPLHRTRGSGTEEQAPSAEAVCPS